MTTRTRNNRQRTANSQTTIESRIDQVILWIALGSLFMIPLLFSYFRVVAVYSELRVSLLHLAAGTSASLWLWQVVIEWSQGNRKSRETFTWDLIIWAGGNFARWTVIAVVLFALIQSASTLLSLLPIISFFGGDDARSGYSLYDVTSMIILLLAVGFRFQSIRRLELLIQVLVASGTVAAIYGTAQHFGWDPIGDNAGNLRAVASFGNTLNFGAYMVMSIPATMAIWHNRTKRPPVWMALITLSLAAQIAGIWFSGGRGPFVGAAAGIVLYYSFAILILPRRNAIQSFAATAAAAVIAAIIIALPSPSGDVGLERAISIADQFSTDTSGSTDIQGGLVGRFSIWRSTLDLATSWEMPVDEPTINSVLRPLFGVGPDLLVYAYPKYESPQSGLAIVEHAHNLGLHILIEIGYLGLVALAAITLLLFLTGGKIIAAVRRSGRSLDKTSILTLAILPSIFGKLVEAQTGVSRVSDMAMMFALVGATVALHEIIRTTSSSDENPAEPEVKPKSTTAISASRPVFVVSTMIAALMVSALFLTLFIGWDIRRLSASRHLAVTYDDPDALVRTLGRQDAQAQAPERDSFTIYLAEQYSITARDQKRLGNEEEALRMLLTGRDLLLDYEKRDPFHLNAQIGLGKFATMMTEWGYTEFAQEMSDRYIRIAEMHPNSPSLVGTAATVMASVGHHDLAIEYADRAIATEPTTKPWSKAWYAKGRSLYETGKEDQAIETLLTAIEKEPISDGATLAHRLLADIYETLGQDEESEKHRRLGGGNLGLG